MNVCEICEEMGCNDNCEFCSYGNPCLGCEHDRCNKDDCCGQCAKEPNGLIKGVK